MGRAKRDICKLEAKKVTSSNEILGNIIGELTFDLALKIYGLSGSD